MEIKLGQVLSIVLDEVEFSECQVKIVELFWNN